MIQQTTCCTAQYSPLHPNSVLSNSFYQQVKNVQDAARTLLKAFPVISKTCQNSLFVSATIVFLASKAVPAALGEEFELSLETPDAWQPFMNCLFDCFAARCTILSRNPFLTRGDCNSYLPSCQNQCHPQYLQAMNITSLNP